MTLSVARDYLSSHIRCNSISPARVHTPFVDGFIAKNYAGREAEIFVAPGRTGKAATPNRASLSALRHGMHSWV